MAEVPPGVEPLDESDPRTFGPYQVLGRLGDGGMGTVYLAQRDGTGPLVAVKAIRADLARVPEFRGRFQREAEAAKRVARSFTAPVLDVATTGTRPYLVTEYIEGPTLTAAVRDRGPLPPADLEWLATAVASALRAIHAAGVIHRDLKPSNILLSRFGARVIDFGIARAPDATTMMTQGAIGTPAFMAPEQALDQPVTTAADIHAWGAVLAYAAAGHAPFDGASLPRILLRVVHDQPDLTGVPANLRPLVARAMAKNPADRPTADDLLDVLQHLHTPANDTPTITGPRVTPPRFVVPQITPPPVAPPWVTAPPTTGHTPPGPTTPPSPVAATAGSNIAPPPRGPVPLLPQAAAPTPGSVEDEAPARVGPLAPPYATAQPLQPPAPPHPRRRPLRRGPAIAIATTAALGVAAAVTAAVLTTRHPAPAAQPLASSTTHAPTTMPSRPTPLGKPLTGPTDKVTSVAFSPDGHTLAAGSNDTTVRLWNVTNPASPTPLGKPLTGVYSGVLSVAFSPDGHTLAAGSNDTTVRLWNVTNPASPTPLGKPLTGAPGPVWSLAFSPDGRTLAVSSSGAIQLWNVTNAASPMPLGTPLTEPVGAVWSVAFSPNGRTLAAGGEDHQVRLWNVADPARPALFERPLTGAADWVRALAFSPDGHTLAAGSNDHTTQLWDVTHPDSPTPLAPPMTGPTGPVTSVAFSSTGRTLAVGCDDYTVRLWDVTHLDSPTLIGQPLTGPTSYVLSVAFSPDGHTLAAGSYDHTIRLWVVP